MLVMKIKGFTKEELQKNLDKLESFGFDEKKEFYDFNCYLDNNIDVFLRINKNNGFMSFFTIIKNNRHTYDEFNNTLSEYFYIPGILEELYQADMLEYAQNDFNLWR